MDLGVCPNVHDMAFRADYEIAAKTKDYFYDIDAMEHLHSFIIDCDRKTEIAKRRLKETQEELSEEANSKANQIHVLGEQIGTLMARAEEIGAAGEVDESMRMLEEVEALKTVKINSEIELRNSMPSSSYQQQKLRVCEVCGAYLGIHDNDRRLADHFGGKLHLGFITIRDKLDQLKALVTDRRALREAQREEMRLRRELDAYTERARSSERSSSQSKSSYDRGDSERSTREDSRDRDRSQSREKQKHKRSSKSRDRSSRKRSSKHSRSKMRKSRSDSKESRHYSRSGSHSKRKHRRRSRSDSRSRNQRSRSGSTGERNGAYQDGSD